MLIIIIIFFSMIMIVIVIVIIVIIVIISYDVADEARDAGRARGLVPCWSPCTSYSPPRAPRLRGADSVASAARSRARRAR